MAMDTSAVNLAPQQPGILGTQVHPMPLKMDHCFSTSRLFQDSGTTEPFQFMFDTSGAGGSGVVHIPSAGALNTNPFHFQSLTASNGLGEASTRTRSKSERNTRFPSSVGLSAHHQVSGVAAANQNGHRESNDKSPMMGVVIQ